MRLIEEREVQSAARRVSQGSVRRARRLGRSRPELVAYVVAATERFSDDAKAAAWRGLELCIEAMGPGASVKRATIDEVLAVHERNLDFALALGECHPRIAARYLRCTPALRQRSLLRRLSDDTASSAPAGERGAVFLLLKTIVDVLDGTALDEARAAPAE